CHERGGHDYANDSDLGVPHHGQPGSRDYAGTNQEPHHHAAEKAHGHEHIQHLVVRDIGDFQINRAEIVDRERIIDLDAIALAHRSALLDVKRQVGVLLDPINI